MRTIYTAIFGKYEDLKEPTVVTPGWKYICFTDQPFRSNVWEVINVYSGNIDPQLKARIYKIAFFDNIDTFESIWIDGSFVINCNLNDWWEQHFKSEITCIKHPIRDCVFEEADACIVNGRGNAQSITDHIKSYEGIVPKHNGLIQSGILMRQQTETVVKLCTEWIEEVLNHSLRDQISFAKIAMNYNINYINWDYRRGTEFKFKGHYPKNKQQ